MSLDKMTLKTQIAANFLMDVRKKVLQNASIESGALDVTFHYISQLCYCDDRQGFLRSAGVAIHP